MSIMWNGWEGGKEGGEVLRKKEIATEQNGFSSARGGRILQYAIIIGY